jgi:hypothetical protein
MTERKHNEEGATRAAHARPAAEREHPAATAPHPALLLRVAGPLAPHQALQLQRAVGNRATARLLGRKNSPPVQTKLVVGPAGDAFEQEADRVAREVVKNLDAPASETVVGVSKAPSAAAARRQPQLVAASPVGAEGGEVSHELGAAIDGARGGGRPLGDGLRAPLERAFGHDFGGVRLHTDARADALNRSLGARAFTSGQDIFFAQGEYAAGSSAGQELLAHELTHVAQQQGAAAAPIQRQIVKKIGKTDLWPEIVGLAMWKTAGEDTKLKLVALYADTKVHEYNSATDAFKKAKVMVDEEKSQTKGTMWGEDVMMFGTEEHSKNFEEYVKKTESEALGRVAKSGHVNAAAHTVNIQKHAADALYWAQKLDMTQLGTQGLVEVAEPGTWQIQKPTKIIHAPVNLQHYIRKIWDEVKAAENIPTIEKFRMPNWGGQVHDGQGTWVQAMFSTDVIWAKGSSTTGEIGTGAEWERRAKFSGIAGTGTPIGKSTAYVRGHLLNDHLGGPGLAYNLVALLGKASPDSINTNAKHHADVEERVKSAVEAMLAAREGRSPSSETVVGVDYYVEAIWGNHNRSQKAVVANAWDEVKFIKDGLEAHTPGSSAQATVKNLYDSAQTSQVGLQRWARIHDAVNAVCDRNLRAYMTIDRLEKLMNFNAELWKWEDQNVPLGLATRLKIYFMKHAFLAEKKPAVEDHKVPNTLPNDPTRPLVRQGEIA